MNLADLIGSDDPELGPAAGLHAVDLLASAGHYVRRAPRIFNLNERTIVGAKYRQDLDTRTQHYPALYRAVFNGALVTGQGTLVTRSATLIHDSCWEMFAQQLLPPGLERLPGDALAVRDTPSRRIERPSLLLKRPWWRNYGHWLVDSAALLALMPGLAMPRDWQIVIGRYDEPRMRQIVYEALGFLAPGVPVLEHWDHETWTFDELHYTAPVSRPPLFKLPQAIAALRALVLSSYPSRFGRRKLYVARGPDKPRRLENEEEIIDLCVAKGFEIIRPEDYPLRQQAQLFNGADVIVGVKGAALTNLLFCTSSASVIVLSPSSWAEPFFWDIAGQLGLRYFEVIGDPTAESESPAAPPFAVDPQLVSQALAETATSVAPQQLFAGYRIDESARDAIATEPDAPGSTTHQTSPDHPGELYSIVLWRLHDLLQPQSYLEIGVSEGYSLRLAKCPSIGVDPDISVDRIGDGVPDRHLFKMTSDQFFKEHDPVAILGGRPIDLAFLDGMHRFEHLLRDFMNTERYCKPNSCITLHDCMPLDRYMAGREEHDMQRRRMSVHPDWWTGDVWKTVAILLRYRPDLRLIAFNSDPTGLILLTNLNPHSEILARNYDAIVREFMALPDDDATFAAYQAALPVVDTQQLTNIVRSLAIPEDTPRLESGHEDAEPIAAAGGVPELAEPPSGSMVAHIHNVGDVEAKLGDWIGEHGSGRWIEGIQITPQSGIANDELEYRVVEGVDQLSAWVQGRKFCGTRGMSLPIRGLSVRLLGAAAEKYECACSAAFADGTGRNLVAAGDVCAAASFAPLEAFQIVVHPRGLMPADASEEQFDLSAEKLMLRFESLGDNCEFGMVQRRFGAEPMGLLRFAGFHISPEERLPALLKALDSRFANLGRRGSVRITVEGEQQEYVVWEDVYHLMYHTFLVPADVHIDQLTVMEEDRLSMLRRKFEEDLYSPGKIFVWKSNAGNTLDEVMALYRTLRRFGNHTLLWVRDNAPDRQIGKVEVEADSLLCGYVRRFAPYAEATDIDYQPWLSVCRNAFELTRSATWNRRAEAAVVPKDTHFQSRALSSLTVTVDIEALRDVPLSRAVLAPAGVMNMPRCCVMNPPATRYASPAAWGNPALPLLNWDGPPEGIFPSQIAYPEMWIARLDDAYYLPYAAPFLPESGILINDFTVPWAPESVGWFRYEGADAYRFPIDLIDTDVYSIDTAFFMGHSVSGHFGHFIGDCLSRMHAWRLCRELFGDVKLLLDHTIPDTKFRERLVVAAGANAQDIVFAQGGVHCRRLLLASPALGVSQYASPTSAKLWQQIRDSFGDAQASWGEKIYLSRSGQHERKLTNEADVENLFESFGFQIVRPEDFSIDEQVSMVSGAGLVAGPIGSAMFNLAFQKRLKSVLIMAPETFVQTTEWLFLAGADCTVHYHIGSRDMPAGCPVKNGDSWRVDLSRLASDINRWLSRVYGTSATVPRQVSPPQPNGGGAPLNGPGHTTDADILDKLGTVISHVFGHPVALSRATTAKDVPGWDSLRQVLIIAGAEEAFGLRFSSAEMDNLRSVGNFADLIQQKLA